jgi:hypothetical protein
MRQSVAASTNVYSRQAALLLKLKIEMPRVAFIPDLFISSSGVAMFYGDGQEYTVEGVPGSHGFVEDYSEEVCDDGASEEHLFHRFRDLLSCEAFKSTT